LFLKAGNSLGDQQKIAWLENSTVKNLKALSTHRFEGDTSKAFFSDLFEKLNRNDNWRGFVELMEPENSPVPDFEERIRGSPIAHFIHICLIRAIREDRTVLASRNFI
jgi:dynein heavy chain